MITYRQKIAMMKDWAELVAKLNEMFRDTDTEYTIWLGRYGYNVFKHVGGEAEMFCDISFDYSSYEDVQKMNEKMYRELNMYTIEEDEEEEDDDDDDDDEDDYDDGSDDEHCPERLSEADKEYIIAESRRI